MNRPEELPPAPEQARRPEYPDAPHAERKTFRFIDLLLDPRGLHTLMIAGSALLALGLVLWLAVIGVFEEPLNVALGLGAANSALLGTGLWLALRTRYRSAGRATAMLACLLLPLNLWFYDAQGLVTLQDGGNLWAAALVCCLVYAGVARLLKDSLFVYAFASGVAMTGLLFLADGNVDRFWEVLAPSTLLVSLGMACVHAERLFPSAAADQEDSSFTREEFGLAFFRAGHALLASGLGVLLAGRIAGRLYGPLLANRGWFEQPDVATLAHAQLAAIALAMAGAYTYGYSYFLSKDSKRFAVSSLLALLWSGLIALDLLGVAFTETLVAGLLASVAVGCHLAGVVQTTRPAEGSSFARPTSLSLAGQLAGAAALVLVMLQLVRGTWGPWIEPDLMTYEFGWGFVLAAVLVGVSQLLSAYRPADRPANAPSRPLRWVGAGLASLAATAGLGHLAPWSADWPGGLLLALLAVVPAAWAVFGMLRAEGDTRDQILKAAQWAAVTLAVLLVPFALFATSGSSLLATMLVGAVFTLLAFGDRSKVSAALTGLTALAGFVQMIVVYQLQPYVPLLGLSAASIVAVAAERFGGPRRVGVGGQLGVAVAAAAGLLLAANRLLAHEANLTLLGMVAGQAMLSAVAAGLRNRNEDEYGYVGLAVLQTIAAGLVLNAVSVLTFTQRLEAFVTVVGCGLVVAGLVGWRTEANKPRADGALTDVNLWLGSVLATVPLTCGLVAVRLFGGTPAWAMLHEAGTLVVGLSLVSVGVLCRLRSTTLAGAAALAVYLLSLVTLFHLPDQLRNVAFYMMAGGAVLFGAALLMSVYRDRLLQLPNRWKEGEGVFAVLKWR